MSAGFCRNPPSLRECFKNSGGYAGHRNEYDVYKVRTDYSAGMLSVSAM